MEEARFKLGDIVRCKGGFPGPGGTGPLMVVGSIYTPPQPPQNNWPVGNVVVVQQAPGFIQHRAYTCHWWNMNTSAFMQQMFPEDVLELVED